MTTLTQEEARKALEEIDSTARQIRHAVRGSLASSVLMLWGVLWIAIFTWSYLIFPRGDRVAWILNGFGVLATALMASRQDRQVRSEAGRKILQQASLLWGVLLTYVFALPFLIPQISWTHRLSLMLSIVMLGYVIMGVWIKETVFIVLGLGITVVILAGLAWLKPAPFLLCMGILGGGGLVAGGVVIRLRWK